MRLCNKSHHGNAIRIAKPAQAEMRRQLLAGLLLLVYLPAFLLASFHVHKDFVAAEDSEVVSIVQPDSQVGQGAFYSKDCACPFCHFLAMLFFFDAGECGSVLYSFSQHQDFCLPDAVCILGHGSLSSPRAPPFCC